MHKLISKFAAAAHLALLAVAPLLLLLFPAGDLSALALLWLSFLAVIWSFAQPSCRREESLSGARARVWYAVRRDPLVWTFVVIVGLAVSWSVNDGVALAYSPEAMRWYLRPPRFPELPASVSSVGLLPFAVAISLLVLVVGVRHSLGRQARVVFALVGSGLSAVLAIVSILMWLCGSEGMSAEVLMGPGAAACLGVAFGIWSIFSLSSVWATSRLGWFSAEMVAFFSLMANVVAVFVFSPPFEFLVCLAPCAVLAALVGSCWRQSKLGKGFARGVACLALSLIVAAFLASAVGAERVLPAKLQAIFSLSPLPADFWSIRRYLSQVAFETWRQSPWVGTGLGTFGFDIRFHLPAEGWKIVPRCMLAPLNAGWMVLAESGVAGAVAYLTPLVLFAWDWVRRAAHIGAGVIGSELAMMGPVTVLLLLVLSFFDASLMRPEVVVAVVAACSVSIASMPLRHSDEGEEKEYRHGR